MNPLRPPNFGEGLDPDYRYSLANERTFLAYIRTALALNGGGLAVVSLLEPFAGIGREVVGVMLIVTGTGVALQSFVRWRENETGMRAGTGIAPSRLPALVAGGVAFTSIIALILLLFGNSS